VVRAAVSGQPGQKPSRDVRDGVEAIDAGANNLMAAALIVAVANHLEELAVMTGQR
jgi:hypothetical protein